MEMQHVKKLVLVDQRVLDEMQSKSHGEYKELLKPADKKAKANMSVELQEMLDDDASDDVKAKIYQQTFSRFRAMQNKLAEPHKGGVNALTTSVPARVVPQQQRAVPLRRARTGPQRQRQEPARLGDWVAY